MSNGRRIRRALGAGLVAVAVAPPIGTAGAQGVAPAPQPALPAAAQQTAGSVHIVSGSVQRADDGAVSAGAGARVDVYLMGQAPGVDNVFLGTTTADRGGAFTFSAPVPVGLANFLGPASGATAILGVTDAATGAFQMAYHELRWDGTQFASAETPAPPIGGSQALTLAGAGAPADETVVVVDTSTPVPGWQELRSLPASGATVQAAAAPAAANSTCRMATNFSWPGQPPIPGGALLIPQPGTRVDVFAALVQDTDGSNWTVIGDYKTGRETFSGNHNSVAVTADFSTRFPGVSLGVSGSTQITTGTGNASNTLLGFGFTLNSRDPHWGGVLNLKYSVGVQTDARLWECIDPIESFQQGQQVHRPAYYGMQFKDRLDGAVGFPSRASGYLALDANGKYARPCGQSTGGFLSPVGAGGYFEKALFTSTTFELGSNLTYSANLAGLAGSTASTKTSRQVTTKSTQMVWHNNVGTNKYLCGYTGDPLTTPTVVVGIGSGTR